MRNPILDEMPEAYIDHHDMNEKTEREILYQAIDKMGWDEMK